MKVVHNKGVNVLENNIKKLTNSELNTNILSLVKSERKITHQVLLYINEIELRRLYLIDECNSMFDFLVKKLSYSESAAYRRLSAARLLKQVPEISDKLESGSLNLTQLSQLQSALKQEKKELKNKFGTSEFSLRDKAFEVICKLENQNQKQSSVIIAQEFGFPVVSEESAKLQKDLSLKLELVFCEADAKLLEKVKALTSHQNPSQSWKDLFLLLAKKELKKWEDKSTCVVKSKAEVNTKNSYLENLTNETENSATEVQKDIIEHSENIIGHCEIQQAAASLEKSETKNQSQRKYLSIKLKRKLFSQANHQCQYVDHITQVRCSGTHFLQIDHAIPLAKGGSDEVDNLRVFCQAHNLKSARDWGLN